MSNWNGKVRCIMSCSKYVTEGEIYNIVNGKIITTNPYESNDFNNIDELNRGSYSKFEEVKDIPKLCEILDVEPNEEFEISYNKFGDIFEDEVFYITHNGYLKMYSKNDNKHYFTDKYIADLINGEYKIIKQPQYSEAEITTLSALFLNGYNYIARDKCGDLWAYEDEPE